MLIKTDDQLRGLGQEKTESEWKHPQGKICVSVPFHNSCVCVFHHWQTMQSLEMVKAPLKHTIWLRHARQCKADGFVTPPEHRNILIQMTWVLGWNGAKPSPNFTLMPGVGVTDGVRNRNAHPRVEDGVELQTCDVIAEQLKHTGHIWCERISHHLSGLREVQKRSAKYLKSWDTLWERRFWEFLFSYTLKVWLQTYIMRL